MSKNVLEYKDILFDIVRFYMGDLSCVPRLLEAVHFPEFRSALRRIVGRRVGQYGCDVQLFGRNKDGLMTSLCRHLQAEESEGSDSVEDTLLMAHDQLEGKTHEHLHAAGRACADRRRIDGRCDSAEIGGGTDIQTRRAQLRMVEDVEELEAEFESHMFGEADFFRKSGINL